MERNYDQKTLGVLWSKSGGICAYPDCENELIIKDIDEIVGHICHIVGLNGPRADSLFPKNKLNKYENLVLMCRHHHGIIDIDELTNTVDKLVKIKSDHENEISKRLSTGKPWEINVSQIYYLNIPRLSILSEFCGFEVDFSFLMKYNDLHSIGFELSTILSKYKSLFTKIKPNIIDDNSITEISDKLVGLTFSYNSGFRTKNVPWLDEYQNGQFKLLGDIKNTPQIYKSLLDYKLILTIDPKWIATTTAFVNLRPSGGRGLFAGIATIKHIDFKNKLILATPLIIGIPKSSFDSFFNL